MLFSGTVSRLIEVLAVCMPRVARGHRVDRDPSGHLRIRHGRGICSAGRPPPCSCNRPARAGAVRSRYSRQPRTRRNRRTVKTLNGVSNPRCFTTISTADERLVAAVAKFRFHTGNNSYNQRQSLAMKALPPAIKISLERNAAVFSLTNCE